ncbi:MAG: hypothetical protein Kow00107_00790 [Planctomycetota bacterium]
MTPTHLYGMPGYSACNESLVVKRYRSLDHPLLPEEFGRAIFHIGHRRGFKSNRKREKTKEDGKILKEINELQKAIDEKGARTLGEFLFMLIEEQRSITNWNDSTKFSEELKIRRRHTKRSMYEYEFDLLWEKQAKFCPERLTDALKEESNKSSPGINLQLSWLKTIITSEHISGVKTLGRPPFRGRLWQRNYCEHVIRDDKSLNLIREYVVNKPLQWSLDR